MGFFSKIFNNNDEKIKVLKKEIRDLKKELENKNKALNRMNNRIKKKKVYSKKAEKISEEVVEEALSNKSNPKQALELKKLLVLIDEKKKLSFSRISKELKKDDNEIMDLIESLKEDELIKVKKPLFNSQYLIMKK
jgi:hypothetical protein